MTETRNLLVEIGVEELPPKSLQTLAVAFADGVGRGLRQHDLEHGERTWFATPRRLAVMVADLALAQPDKQVEKRGPALAAAYDENGEPTRAATGFARSCGVSVAELETIETDRGRWLAHRFLAPGKPAAELLPGLVDRALTELPVPKRMRWGAGDVEFVRPAHWVLLLLGEELVKGRILGLETGRETRGHRFYHPGPIALAEAGAYLETLREPGRVIADFGARKALVRESVAAAARAAGGEALIEAELLDEATALVEWPAAVAGSFDEEFLQLPDEVLSAVMQRHQKSFPVLGEQGLRPQFIAVANIASSEPEVVRRGNERVIRPRLGDAAFFWQRDLKQPLASLAPQLQRVVFREELGSLADKTERMASLGVYIAEQLGLDAALVERAARLSKCDLLTDLVGEFPELQGIMGRHYALAASEPEEVARALDEQYQPRRAGAALPQTGTGRVLSIADKLDTLLGIFAIGEAPTGDKDPFSLRRAALGCLRILIECELPLDLEACLLHAARAFPARVKAREAAPAAFDFMMERLRRYYLDNGARPDVFEAVSACRPVSPHDFNLRMVAVGGFLQLPEAASLAAANKRISNLLKQADCATGATPDEGLFEAETERELHQQLQAAAVEDHLAAADYTAALSVLAGLRQSVDAFFDEVMVMCDDPARRGNRLALLSRLRQLFLTTADVSRLQV